MTKGSTLGMVTEWFEIVLLKLFCLLDTLFDIGQI